MTERYPPREGKEAHRADDGATDTYAGRAIRTVQSHNVNVHPQTTIYRPKSIFSLCVKIDFSGVGFGNYKYISMAGPLRQLKLPPLLSGEALWQLRLFQSNLYFHTLSKTTINFTVWMRCLIRKKKV